MRYGSVCSGIEAATVAWHPLGWQPAFFSEIEKFPRAVLRHRWPGVPLHGDFTTIGADDYGPIDLLVGGTPCQSFSVAGLRRGLDDERGNLALEYLRLADRLRPRWLVWENVPGVLSSSGGRDFGAFLGGLAELGYGFAWRVLDAQYCRVDGHPRAVPQRRRRVFVVGYLGDWRCAAAVLLERESLRGHPPPRRKAGQRVADSLTVGANQYSGFCGEPVTPAEAAPTLAARTRGGGGLGTDFDCDGGLIASTGDVAHCLETTCNDYSRADGFTMIAHALRGEGFDASEDGTGPGAAMPVAFHPTQDPISSADGSTHALGCGSSGGTASVAVAFTAKDYGGDAIENVSPTLRAGGHAGSHANAGVMPAIATPYAVRRLTPRECERLQGFPDDYTAIPYRGKSADLCPDGPRYKALGNSMAVNVMRWLGLRIQAVESIIEQQRTAADPRLALALHKETDR